MIEQYKPAPIIWDSPGNDSSDSMPLGNGDIGINLWTENNGDLLFYISKTDAWDENSRLLKIGRIRISLTPNPFHSPLTFSQSLNTYNATITIESELQNKTKFNFLIYVNANQPTIHLQCKANIKFNAKVQIEIWRTEQRKLSKQESHGSITSTPNNQTEIIYPDTILDSASQNSLLWCHRNQSSCWLNTLNYQHIADFAKYSSDPLLNRTFGALLEADNLTKINNSTLQSQNLIENLNITIHCLTALTNTLDEWITQIKQLQKNNNQNLENSFKNHTHYWHKFWQNSYIKIYGSPEAETVSRGYELQHFINACAGRGQYPIKFNGSIFNVDSLEENEPYNADYRRWGGAYWFQNTRLIYWQMIHSGDFEMIKPLTNMFLNALPLALHRCKKAFNFDNSAYFPETMSFWGTFRNADYGEHKNPDLTPYGIAENSYIKYYFQNNIELLILILETYKVSKQEYFLNSFITLAPPILNFYKNFYNKTDENGKIILSPTQSIETWHEAINPTPDIAGLHYLLGSILSLPTESFPCDFRSFCKEFKNKIPPIPTRTYKLEKKSEILPALQYDKLANFENPELYAVFPYKIFGIGKDNLDTAINTWKNRKFKGTGGWRQDPIQAALLGFTEEAKNFVVQNFSTPHIKSRFPAFWGPNFDWTPDQDHGNSAAVALQFMLLQSDENTIRILPSWPQDWNCHFKLHAHNNTIVEASYENGSITQLKITPENPAISIITSFPIGNPQNLPKRGSERTTFSPPPSIISPFEICEFRKPQSWEKKREELKNIILNYEYGQLPPEEKISIELLHSAKIPNTENSLFNTYKITTGPYQNFSFLMYLHIPDIKQERLPVILCGDACWKYINDTVVNEVLRRNFILATFNRTEFAPDSGQDQKNTGIYPMYPDFNFGAISAWAWGYHRVIDALFQLPFVDSAKIAITGHSRGGKTVLLAAATDERIALACANNSGTAGAALYSIQSQGAERLQDILHYFPYWFSPNLANFANQHDNLPFDQHFLLALIAPRPLLLSEALADKWANPLGTWHAFKETKKIYKLLNAEQRIGISFRPGEHGHKFDDWLTFLDFTEYQLLGKKQTKNYNFCPFYEYSCS